MESKYLLERRARMLGIKPLEDKPKAKSIPIRSVKRMAEEKLYSKKKKEYLTKHIRCEVPGCNHAAEELHHQKGRIGKLLYNEKYFMGVCIPHHRKIEDDPTWAIENKLSVSRLIKN